MTEYKIFSPSREQGKWILVKREKSKKNWGFVAEETNPIDCFKHLPGTAGIGAEQVFIIKRVE